MDVLKKIPVREQDPKERATNFKEVCLGYNQEEAQEEASRCINCKNAKCIQGCPVAINIPKFIAEVKEGKFEDAANTIAESSALPAVCGQSFIGILSGIVVIWAVMAAVTIVLLRNTPYGRKIYSVGTNEQAARFSGIHTGRVTFSVYLISAVIAAVSGFFLVGYTGTSFLDVGTSYNTKTIAAVIIGGTAITGGKGGYIGTIAGAIIMTILDDFLTIVNIPEAGRQIMQGVIIVLLVLIYSREKHKK